jgi:septal ring factor EnvC (AmiA/AmiB activator)
MRRGIPAVLALLAAAALPLAAPAPLRAEITTITGARRSADELRDAIADLRAARGARDRVAALTRTIRAYESGLGALRDGLRRAAIREGELTADFNAKRDRIGQLLSVMATMDTDSSPLLLLHPDGPEGSVRSAMVLSAVTPALQAEAEVLSRQLAELAELRRIQADSSRTLEQGLGAAQEARAALAQAMQDRTDLPRRFLEDPEELRTLKDSAATLDAFAAGLVQMETDISAPLGDFEGAKGALPLPVLGRLLRRAGEADAAGIMRDGLLVATRPAALVTAPWPATIRYRGPLLDYGNVMILEPASGYLLVLAGMGTVFGETGDVLAAGAPVGLMPGADGVFDGAGPPQDQIDGGADRTETLYIEIRQGKTPVDPAPWFRETRE